MLLDALPVMIAVRTIVLECLLGANSDLRLLSGTTVPSRQCCVLIRMDVSHGDHLWNVVLNDDGMATGRELIGSAVL